MNKFANLWPDELDESAPLRDLGYAPEVRRPPERRVWQSTQRV